MSEQRRVIRLRFRQRNQRLLGDDEHVNGCLWVDVFEGEREVIFVENFRRDFPIDDFGENRFFHPADSCLS